MVSYKLFKKQRGRYTSHNETPTELQKHPSTTILKHANVWAKVNKSQYVHILKIKKYKKITV